MTENSYNVPAPQMASLASPQPRYMQLAKTLLNEIESGKYPVGSQLPTEVELCEQFGVSRATAREALRRLVQLGLVVRQPRVGTTVKAISAQAGGYRQNIADVSDLYQYATDTTLVIESSDTIEVDALQAGKLEAGIGETWLHLRGRRHAAAQPLPICTTELWLHPAFRAIRGIMGPLRGAVHAAIEEQFGERVVAVEQEIRAVVLSREQAAALQAAPRSPALWICRRYRNRHGQLVEVSESTHPADRFSYNTMLRRDWEAGSR
jgi:DNA-binding GntR family transcriptional regulator